MSRSPLTLPLNVVNTSPKSLSLQGTADSDGLQVNPPEKPVGPGKTCTVKVAYIYVVQICPNLNAFFLRLCMLDNHRQTKQCCFLTYLCGELLLLMKVTTN